MRPEQLSNPTSTEHAPPPPAMPTPYPAITSLQAQRHTNTQGQHRCKGDNEWTGVRYFGQRVVCGSARGGEGCGCSAAVHTRAVVLLNDTHVTGTQRACTSPNPARTRRTHDPHTRNIKPEHRGPGRLTETSLVVGIGGTNTCNYTLHDGSRSGASAPHHLRRRHDTRRSLEPTRPGLPR